MLPPALGAKPTDVWCLLRSTPSLLHRRLTMLLLPRRLPLQNKASHDFGGEIIPMTAKDHKVRGGGWMRGCLCCAVKLQASKGHSLSPRTSGQ